MTATVSNGNVIALEYTLKLDDNEVIETNVGKAPLTYTQGANQIIRGIETAVEGMTLGEAKQVIVSPADGYGIRDLTALYELPKQKVPEDITVGMRLRGTDPNGRVVQPVVKEIKDHTVLLDFNHPLAGKTLFCEVKVVDVQKEENLEG
jgi:FKBP-type peptidyl-prolyl cis-trans isomerase SlyD